MLAVQIEVRCIVAVEDNGRVKPAFLDRLALGKRNVSSSDLLNVEVENDGRICNVLDAGAIATGNKSPTNVSLRRSPESRNGVTGVSR